MTENWNETEGRAMTNHLVETELNALADRGGAPEPGTRAAEHLATCDDCRAALDALTSIDAAATALPQSLEPARDLWPDIAARLGPRGVVAMGEARSRRRARGTRPWLLPLLAAAALLLLLVPVTLLVRVNGEVGGNGWLAANDAGAAALVAFAPAEAEYLDAAGELRRELELRRDRLAPETIEVVEANLAIIEEAVAEARRALEADPSNAELPHLLAAGYQAKIDLLANAIRMADT